MSPDALPLRATMSPPAMRIVPTDWFLFPPMPAASLPPIAESFPFSAALVIVSDEPDGT